jgi:hypothetical protein
MRYTTNSAIVALIVLVVLSFMAIPAAAQSDLATLNQAKEACRANTPAHPSTLPGGLANLPRNVWPIWGYLPGRGCTWIVREGQTEYSFEEYVAVRDPGWFRQNQGAAYGQVPGSGLIRSDPASQAFASLSAFNQAKEDCRTNAPLHPTNLPGGIANLPRNVWPIWGYLPGRGCGWIVKEGNTEYPFEEYVGVRDPYWGRAAYGQSYGGGYGGYNDYYSGIGMGYGSMFFEQMENRRRYGLLKIDGPDSYLRDVRVLIDDADVVVASKANNRWNHAIVLTSGNHIVEFRREKDGKVVGFRRQVAIQPMAVQGLVYLRVSGNEFESAQELYVYRQHRYIESSEGGFEKSSSPIKK